MSVYLYELPTTGAINFSDFCVDHTEGSAYSRQLSNATQARANLRGALKESKRAEHGEKDYLKLVKILDDYLPQLLGVMSCVDSHEVGLKSEPVFSWRTTLSANLFNTSPRQSVASLHADLAFTLLTYAFALSNLARSSVNALGAYEVDPAISDASRKEKDEKLNFAVTLLCRASGLFAYVCDTVLVEWDTEPPSEQHGARPPDLSRDVNSALSKMSLADAQTLAIRKLLSKSAYDSTLTPGPPLPKSHPSPALIAKLHLECASLYSSARALVKTSGSGDTGGVSAELRHYLADEAAFNSALAHKWLGVDAGEQSNSSKGGEAVAFLAWSKKELEELKDGGRGLGVGKAGAVKDKKEKRKEKVSTELESVNVFYRHYKKINDSLSFQPVPPQNELQSSIPAGRLAIAIKPFARPTPAFGPGSVEYIRRQTEGLDVADNESRDGGSRIRPGANPHSTGSGSYAGAGSYF